MAFAPAIFTAMYPAMLASMWTHFKTMQNKSQSPYLVYYNAFYLLIFSIIPHKELRFLIPIVPFAFVMIGELVAQTIKKGRCLGTLASLSIKIFIIVELIVMGVMTKFH